MNHPSSPPLSQLLQKVRACSICAAHLPHGVRPVVQISKRAGILIAGQAPGSRVHETGIPFDDPSGNRLRDWMGVTKEEFYNPDLVAILPMGFCFPGSGKSGDLPPRLECAPAWRKPLLGHLPNLQLTLVIGQYAQAWHLDRKQSVTDAVLGWREHWPMVLPLPHPSPRNRLWFKKNPWFDSEVLPRLKTRVREIVGD